MILPLGVQFAKNAVSTQSKYITFLDIEVKQDAIGIDVEDTFHNVIVDQIDLVVQVLNTNYIVTVQEE